MKKKNLLNTITSPAQELYDLDVRIDKFEESFKPLKEQRDALREELLSALKQSHLKNLKIKTLIDTKILTPLEQTAEAYAEYVKANTGLALEKWNYDKIIERLTALQ